MSKAKKIAPREGDALARAIKALQIDDVGVVSSTATTHEDFDAKYQGQSETLAYQTKQLLLQTEIAEVETAEKLIHVFKAVIEFGIRIGEKDELNSSKEDPKILASLECRMVAYYIITDPAIIDDIDAQTAFFKANVPYHLWPYWREFASSSLQRMNLPKLILPFMQRPGNI